MARLSRRKSDVAGRPNRIFLLVTVATCALLAWRQSVVDFVGAPAARANADVTARAASRTAPRKNRYKGRDSFEEHEAYFAELNHFWQEENPLWDEYWAYDEETDVLREVYPGARNWGTYIFCLFGTLFFFTFMFVGYEIWVQQDLCTDFPGYLKNLRRPPAAKWHPNGVAMSSIGALGSFILVPFNWYCLLKNPGEGGCYFDRNNRTIKRIYDGDIFAEISLDDVKEVRLTYDSLNQWTGTKEVSLIKKERDPVTNDEIHFVFAGANSIGQWGRYDLECKGKALADYLGLPFDVNLDGE